MIMVYAYTISTRQKFEQSFDVPIRFFAGELSQAVWNFIAPKVHLQTLTVYRC